MLASQGIDVSEEWARINEIERQSQFSEESGFPAVDFHGPGSYSFEIDFNGQTVVIEKMHSGNMRILIGEHDVFMTRQAYLDFWYSGLGLEDLDYAVSQYSDTEVYIDVAFLPFFFLTSAILGGGGGNTERIITGFTKHGLDRAIDRNGVGVSESAMLDAVKNGLKVTQSDGTIKCTGKNAVVILNKQGKVVSTWATNTDGG
jgi:hypothetical protein